MPENKENYSYIVNYGGDNVLKLSKENLQYYGQINYVDLPLTSSLHFEHYSFQSERPRIHSLKNILDKNFYKSNHFLCTSNLGNKLEQELTLISIPSIFFGSSIEKGSVLLESYYSGTLIARLQDSKQNGEIIETYGNNTGSVAGVVLYDQGFVVLTGSWNIGNGIEWRNFITGTEENMASSSYDFKFNGTSYIPTITMMAHAPRGEFNFSNNPTFIKHGQNINATLTSSNYYVEPQQIEIKNVTKYPYDNFTGSLEKQTYISKIAIYDERKNLIGIAKLAKPVRKSENRDFTFKLKLDL